MIHYQLITLIFRNVVTFIYGGWFIYIGIQHFIDPDWFEPIVPGFLLFPKFWVLVSGVFEVMLGLLLIIPVTRKLSGISLALFLTLIYIANINMWIFDIPIGGNKLSTQGHILRGIIQLLLIITALYIAKVNPLTYIRPYINKRVLK